MQPWWKKWLKKSYQPNLLNSSVRFISKCNCFIFELLQNNSYYLALIHECQCSFKNPLTRGILKKDLSSTILCNRFVMSWRLNWFSLFAWCFLTQGVADDYFRAWPICTWLPFSWPQISFSWFFSDLLAIVSQKTEYAIPRFPRMIKHDIFNVLYETRLCRWGTTSVVSSLTVPRSCQGRFSTLAFSSNLCFLWDAMLRMLWCH